MFSFWGEIACDLQLEDVFEATSGAPVFCPVGLCLQTMLSSSTSQQSDRSWRRRKSCGCAYVPFYNVHLSCATQASWAGAVLVSGTCPSSPWAKMPLSSSSPADVLLPASHTSCGRTHFILHSFGAFLPFTKTNLDLPLPHCCPAWGMVCDSHAPRASSALGQQGGTAEFFQLIYMCVYTHWAVSEILHLYAGSLLPN